MFINYYGILGIKGWKFRWVANQFKGRGSISRYLSADPNNITI